MDKKRRTRYLLAIYLLVASFAIILALVSILYALDPLQTLLMNLSTELLGVALIFFLVNRLFLLEEWNLSERIERLANRLERRTGFLRGADYREPEVIEQLLNECSEICLLGYGCTGFLRSFLGLLKKRVHDGAHLRIMAIDPESKAAELLREHSKTSGAVSSSRALGYARWIAEESQNGGKGRVEVRLLNWIPSCSLILIDADKPGGYVRVSIYPPFYQSSLDERAHFALTRWEDERWYNTFIDQYERLWSQARPFDLNQAG
jgi:hypothetical protein